MSTLSKQTVLQFILSLNHDVYQLCNLAQLHYSLGNVATGSYSKKALFNIFKIHKCTAPCLISVKHAHAAGLSDIVELSPDTIKVVHCLIQLGPLSLIILLILPMLRLKLSILSRIQCINMQTMILLPNKKSFSFSLKDWHC